MPPSQRARTVLLTLLTLIAVVGAMKWTQAVTLPLAFAIFIAMVVQPVYSRLRAHLSRRQTVLAVTALVLAVFSGFVWAVAESVDEVAEDIGRYEERLKNVGPQIEAWSGIGIDWSALFQHVHGNISHYLSAGVAFIGSLILFLGFLVLAISELESYREKFQRVLAERLIEPAHSLSRQFYRYLLVRTAICLVSGVFATVYTWALGLDFPLIWGALTFLLNYIPTLGTVVAVVIPSLFALLQFGDPVRALWILGGLTAFELFMGNYVDPRWQGRSLSLSPLVVLFSLAFWGWVWGIGGALLAVPLTVAVAVGCRNFRETAWIAELLTAGSKDSDSPSSR